MDKRLSELLLAIRIPSHLEEEYCRQCQYYFRSLSPPPCLGEGGGEGEDVGEDEGAGI